MRLFDGHCGHTSDERFSTPRNRRFAASVLPPRGNEPPTAERQLFIFRGISLFFRFTTPRITCVDAAGHDERPMPARQDRFLMLQRYAASSRHADESNQKKFLRQILRRMPPKHMLVNQNCRKYLLARRRSAIKLHC